jgi:hypothetical protein
VGVQLQGFTFLLVIPRLRFHHGRRSMMTKLIQYVRRAMQQIAHSGVEVSSGILSLYDKLGPVGCRLIGVSRCVNELLKGEACGML